MGNLKNNSLPEELIVEILLNLPIKSLLRWRCVSKFWYNFIKSPNFINTHLLKNRNSSYIILIGRLFDSSTTLTFLDYESLDVILPDLELPLVVHEKALNVCGPCNGLICLSDCHRSIVICNPSTRRFRTLPSFTCPEGYDPDFDMNSIGFGFDSNTNDYKVVCFITLIATQADVPDVLNLCLIYNLGTNTWREIDFNHGINIRYVVPISSGLLFNGAFHWLVHNRRRRTGEDMFIFHFNMNTELFGYMNIPYTDPGEVKNRELIVVDDSLALFSYSPQWRVPQHQFFDIWVMKEYGVKESWTKQFSVGPLNRIQRPLTVLKNKKILMEGHRGREDVVAELVSCRLDNNEIRSYPMAGFRYLYEVLVDHDSLVSI